MQQEDKKKEKTLLERIFSMETGLCLVGVVSVAYGFSDGIKEMPLFFGVCIIGGSILLHFVRKKDWDAHWAEQDRIRQANERRMAQEREKKKQG